ncbi:Bug family tripartite tricarboxylate transporter substrate binding protein [Variovorax terrae]|uniref:Tripartite tricarboxylate transporter substrate binding protein n=1 Tax=Variovorax terrae TaxID=2923278 RepID=A0A9X1VWN9_9BURK|nr:tripartite tricarboxylate transporter substrate binding protein [Variovorax terrae]MCJ0764634.1 tripartite tricarboxylate transporter substrate binding protein [Variovorax terrae]
MLNRLRVTSRRSAAIAVAIALALAMGLVFAQARSYPAKPIRVLIPFAAGGALDAVGRPLGEAFQRTTGQPWVIDNLGGAGGTIATQQIARAPNDGYQLLLASNGQISVAPYVYPSLPYNPERDLAPIVHIVDSSAVLYAGVNSPYRTVQDVLAKARSMPGAVNFAHTGSGSVSHLAMELLAKEAKVKFTAVPYKGASMALPDLASGQVPLLFTYVSSARSMVDSGRVRPIAVAAEKRLESLPDVPTFAEAGLPQVVAKLWIGLMAPRGTPQPVVDFMSREVNALLGTPDMKKRLEPQGLEVKGGSIDQFQQMIAEDSARWRELSKVVDLSPK